MTDARVHLDVPEPWRRLPIAPDGDARGQRALIDGWLVEQGRGLTDDGSIDKVVTKLAVESRRASREAVGFAAILLDLLPVAEGGAALLVGSLSVSFRHLPGETDPAVAAHGTLDVLRQQLTGARYATRRLELVGLGADPGRPAVLVRDQRFSAGVALSVCQVLWLVAGSSQLASVAVATPNRELAQEFTEVALRVATSLRVEPVREMAGS